MIYFRGLRGFYIWPGLLLVGIFLSSSNLGAQTCNAAPFLAVSSWTGSVTITGTGSGSITDPASGTVYTYNVQESISLAPVLTLAAGSQNTFTGPENGTVNINDQYTITSGNPASTYTYVATANGTSALGGLGLGATLSISSLAANCGYEFNADYTFSPYTITINGSASGGTNNGPWGTANIVDLLEAPTVQTPVAFPASGNTLSGSTTFSFAPNTVPSGFLPTPVVNWTVSWNFTPTARPLDLLVTIPNYATWRPIAGKTETEFALNPDLTPATLQIQAQLVYKDTQLPTPFGPDKVTFLLASVSHEPGVSMNWPAQKDLYLPSPPDLSFKDLSGSGLINSKFQLNPDGTQADYMPASTGSNPLLSVLLQPYDWGGWGTLNVTAIVNGQTIQGHFSGDQSQYIVLPKRQPGMFVADVWKTQHNIPLSTVDSDDSEPDPTGQPGCIGDGFTLYEEYRGFMENGKHIEGDPANKDLFVQNVVGPDAEPGIWLFTDLTGLSVHKDLLPNEIDGIKGDARLGNLGSRVININHAAGAHEVDQHAVILTPCVRSIFQEANRQVAVAAGAGVHGRPGLTEVVCVQRRDEPGEANPSNSHYGVISAVDTFLQYDVTVAHELLHSVGVDHHGDGDSQEVFYVYVPGTPENSTDTTIVMKNGQPVHLLTETGVDVYAGSNSKVAAYFATFCRIVSSLPFLFPSSYVGVCNALHTPGGAPISAYVGNPHHEFSGNDQCAMRYWFGMFYPSISNSTNYYITPAGSESVGFNLCDSPVGTGVNLAGRLPQPRYFDAAPGRGGCKFWVCVNDSNAPPPD